MRTGCPCGSDRYASCCGPLHRGAARAETALALMRSRYSAFALGEWDYLAATLHPDRRRADEREAVRAGGAGVTWTELEILGTQQGGGDDDVGFVEFAAHYEDSRGPGVLRERSRFVRVDGQWLYVEAAPAARPAGRNDPCPCGSGVKYKRCCGRAG